MIGTSAVRRHPVVFSDHLLTGKRRGALCVAVIILVLLAFLPVVGRAEATSVDVSPSRATEVVFMAAAFAAALLLPIRLSWARNFSVAAVPRLIGAFTLWAAVTALGAPLMVIGTYKALELLVLTIIAFQVSTALATERLRRGLDACDCGVLAIIGTIVILLAANIPLYGTPFPIQISNDWLRADNRPRLVFGENHALTTALLLSLGMIFSWCSKASWPLKVPIVAGLAVLLHLCDARSITVGTLLSFLLAVYRSLPRSSAKTMVALVALAGVLIGIIYISAAVDLSALLLGGVGEDVFTLNSRVDLWQYALGVFAEHPIMGVGYYSSRMYLLNAFPFAGNAHNSVLEVLLSTGLVGTVLMGPFLAFWIYSIYRTGDKLLIGISPVLCCEGTTDPILYTPHFGMFFLMFALINAHLQYELNEALQHQRRVGVLRPDFRAHRLDRLAVLRRKSNGTGITTTSEQTR